MNKISNKVSYATDKIDPLIHGIFCGSRRNNINICSNLIITFGIKNILFVFFKTPHVSGGDKYAQNL